MSDAVCLENVEVLCTPERHAACASTTCPLMLLERAAIDETSDLDKELETLCDQGSRELFDQEITALYDEYAAKVYRSIRRGLPHKDAEEVVNDAFLAARKHWERVRGYDNPMAYVFASARNLRLKLLNFYLRIPETESYSELPIPDPCGHVDVRVQLIDALRVLSPRQAEVIFLHYWVGVPTRALAEELGITDGNVQRILSEARDRLRRVLREPGSTTAAASPGHRGHT